MVNEIWAPRARGPRGKDEAAYALSSSSGRFRFELFDELVGFASWVEGSVVAHQPQSRASVLSARRRHHFALELRRYSQGLLSVHSVGVAVSQTGRDATPACLAECTKGSAAPWS